ncbi:outer membrane protein transport protein [Fontimonas sp. SYSU GA230001]|uniref:OmpP1/FadL family transporter n=1 Tax=Fontimonas sp. SYSU GA230001 TaxID=3142450 RepID=UPI0032B36BCD
MNPRSRENPHRRSIRHFVRAGLGLAATAALCAAAPAMATNGYFAHGYSASQNALGGAGTALTEDALIVTINPAGSAWVGERLDINFSVFSPVRDYSAGPVGSGAQNSIMRISEGRVGSDNELYYIPGIAYVAPIDEVSSWGIAMYGNGGMNTEYHGNTTHFGEGFADPLGIISLETECGGSFGGGSPVNGAGDMAGFCGNDDPTASVDLIQMFIVPHYARKLGERSSIGIAPVLAGQRFRADGLMAFSKFSNKPDKVSDNGYEWSYGYGGRIGFLTGLIPGVGLGGSYQTRIRMTEFKEYAGLFADDGGFDIPSTWNVGVSLHFNSDFRFVYDYQRTNFSEVKSVGNPFDTNDFVNNCAIPRLFYGLTNGLQGSNDPSGACLGAATGPGFGWRDVVTHKFGVQYKFAAFKFRAGYSKADQPIPDSEVLFNILAPAVIEEHYTLGLDYQYSRTTGLSLAAMYAKSNPIVGKNALSNTDATMLDLLTGADTSNSFGADPNDQDIHLDMHQWQITLGYTYRFE